jgi:hypothetical protein
MKYDLPNFKKLKPIKLNLELDKIKKKYNSIIYSQDTDMLKNLVIKIFNHKELSSKELLTFFHNYTEIREIANFKEKENKKFFLDCIKDTSLNLIEKNIENILEFMYQNILLDNNKIEEEMLEISDSFLNKFSLNYDSLSSLGKISYEYLLSEQNIITFLETKFFLYVSSESDYRYFSILYRIESETTIYSKMIDLYFDTRLFNILKDNNSINNIKNIGILNDNINSIQNKINIYKRIFNYYIENDISTEYYSNDWFNHILQLLGNPENNELWKNFNSEQVEIFKQWLVFKELHEIFSINVQDERRLKFWKKYINYIEKVKFVEELNQAILMETKNYVFIEFGKRGNAFYVYKKEHMNIKKLEDLQRTRASTRIISNLKSRYNAVLYLSHSGTWESKFKLELSRLNYNVRR